MSRNGTVEYTLKELLLYFLRLGACGFGGPIALAGYIQRDLAAKRHWITQDQYLRGLALSQLAPGPLAVQLAIYIGYTKSRFLGGTLVGVAFVLPSFLMVVVLGFLYCNYGGLSFIKALFYGIGPCVIAIIAQSAYRLSRATCKGMGLCWVIFGTVFAATVITQSEMVWLLLLGGILALLIYAPPRFLFSGRFALLLPLGTQGRTLLNIFLFFAKSSLFVFGSGLAIVPFLHTGVVQQFQWLNEKQFLDAVAVAMITPGPLVISVGFIGYLVGGLKGATVAAVAIFLPVWLLTIALVPSYEKVAKNRQVKAFVKGITAATCGAIAGAVIILGRGTIKDIPTALIAAGALGALTRFKIPEPLLIGTAGLLGLCTFGRV
jgi:chromate transporter